ncbi:MAG: hypothetical protein RL660_246 [Bacteroidota bacterium]|jgi:thiol-disulfide isomerase/thioredoxin
MQACNNDSFKVKGKIANAPEQNFTLYHLGNVMTAVDSGKVSSAGEFSFSGTATEPQLYKLSFEQGKDILLVLEKDNATLTGDWQQLEANYELSGSKYTNEAKALLASIRQSMTDKNTLMILGKRFSNEKNVTQEKKVQEDLKNLQTKTEANLMLCADTSKCLPVAALAAHLVQPQNNIDWLKKFYTQSLAKFPGSKYAQELYNVQMPALAASAQEEPATTTSATPTTPKAPRTDGAVLAPDFALTKLDGTAFTLSSMRGKYVLVDFWASWCGPCRAENPNVVAAYQKFKGKNFDIVGVSLDDDKDAWQAAVTRDNLTWTHVSDLQKWASVVVRLYNLNSIPSNVLIDPDGYVIAKDLREEALHTKLQEVLK